jgi:glycosyltransferase involved in cell wall biosynthesis
MDNQWLRTPKQLLGIASSRVYLRPYFDAAFLPGRRQMDFALRLGFSRESIFEGLYSADVETFRHIPALTPNSAADRTTFLFVGRLVESKGVHELLEAYAAYRDDVGDPWPLLIAGTGPLEALAARQAGVELVGFLEPGELARCFGRASFLVLPSRFEPWGVVVHEAMAAGLGAICTTRVGAADVFVRDGANGRIVNANAPGELADALAWAHGLSDARLADVSGLSRSLAMSVTPERWAETVLGMAGMSRGERVVSRLATRMS